MTALIGFITLPIVTWFFAIDDIGRISMLQLLFSFTTMFFCLGLDQAYIREFHESRNKEKLFKLVITPALIVFTIVIIIIIVNKGKLSSFILGESSVKFDIMIILGMFGMLMTRFLSLILRMNERALEFSLSQLLPKILYLLIIFFYVAANLNKNLNNLLIANVASIILAFSIFAWNTKFDWLRSCFEPIDLDKVKSLMAYGLPLVIGSLAYWALTATDKILIRKLSNYEDLGVYSVSVSFAGVAILFQRVFSTIWAPTVYKWASQNVNQDKINQVTRYVLLVVVVVFSVSGLLSWLIDFVLPDNYLLVKWIVISCLGAPLLYTLSETTAVGINVSRKTHYSMFASTISFIFNAVSTSAIIPFYGSSGAAVTTCISFWVFLILRTEFSNFLWKPIPRLTIYLYTLLLVLGAALNTLYGEVLQSGMYLYWAAILLSTLLFFYNEYMSFIYFIKINFLKIEVENKNEK
ncbi:TPA: oligosaccharide flippase family protein [Vibrio alginolyticus]|nr:oligosaccharide flippase family protein [Vibrio alginolyticus]MBO0243894.1 oligosaccharide flippase family protein [Vibrio sp. Vb0592]HCZ8834599.1 oligosaccharide flippase family protein [Vibrio alginolyticus]HCZ8838169.1 oligosaccharide flippase family protein [Vibrio alginolyticus]HCZ8944089.1 oligosaccharide flippase family protein [Vibrio alginolyticus]HCZ8949202.1 oligosaccharide flippase family protein [Vibrio alginolyticus]